MNFSVEDFQDLHAPCRDTSNLKLLHYFYRKVNPLKTAIWDTHCWGLRNLTSQEKYIRWTTRTPKSVSIQLIGCGGNRKYGQTQLGDLYAICLRLCLPHEQPNSETMIV